MPFKSRPIVAITYAVIVAAGCLGPTASSTPAVTSPGKPAASICPLAPTPSASPTPSAEPPSPAPVPTPTASPSPTPSSGEATGPGDVLGVIVDGLRVRSEPRIADDSKRLEPLLSRRQLVYVVKGPVRASGYDWFRVIPFTADLPKGWIAAASRDGEPWVRPTKGGCHAVEPSVTLLSRLSSEVALRCFAGTMLTFDARIVSCMADVDAPPIKPAWFGLQQVTGNGDRLLPCLVEPGQRQIDFDDPFWLFVANIDPDGAIPDPVPIDTPIRVTGMYDHPAARRCRSEDEDAVSDLVSICRSTFAITKIRRAD
jgi:hypothetical protein